MIDSTIRPAFFRPLRRLVLVTCGALLVVLAFSASGFAQQRATKPAAPPPSSDILLENRTYTPLWYRVHNGSAWGEWTPVIPGDRHRFKQWPKLTLEASIDGKVQSFPLLRGNTYCYRRTSPVGNPSFVCDDEDRGRGLWHIPVVPTAQEFTTSAKSKTPGALFQPLERFLDRCERFGDEYRLSLKEFTQECRQAYEEHGALPDDLKYVKGFTWFFGFLIDADNSDVVLLGVQDTSRPPFEADCLATAIRAVHAGQIPVASLENDPDDHTHIKSLIDGVPWGTRWAELMIDADYTMKRLSLGLTNPRIKGMRSEFEHAYQAIRRDPEGFRDGKFLAFGSRRWFNFDNAADRAAVSQDGNVVVFYRNPIRISSELCVNGKYGTGLKSPTAEAFVHDFNQHFDLLSRHYPSLAQLQALYRVFDLFSHIRDVGGRGPVASSFWVETYESPYAGPPATLPTFNKKGVYKWEDGDTTWTWTPSVTGGVEMQVCPATVAQRRGAISPLLQAKIFQP